MDNITLVTGFYNFKEIKSREEKSIDKYFEHVEHLFKTNVNIVFFIQKQYNYRVWLGRKKHGLLDKTLIINREVDELVMMDKIDEGIDILNKNPIRHTLPENNTPVYYYFMYNKVYLVEEIMDLNPFDSEYFGWVDFGINHVMKGYKIEDLLTPIPVKVRMAEIKHVSNKELDDVYTVAKTFIARTVGGFWIGNKIMVKLFIDEVKKWIQKLWKLQLITHDENIYGIILMNRSEIMDVVYGDYHNFFYNWHSVNSFNQIYLNNLRHCRWANSHKRVIDMYMKLKPNCWDKMRNIDKFDVYIESMISAFYTSKKLYNIITKECVSFIEGNKDDDVLISKLRHHSDKIIMNLNFGTEKFTDRINNVLNPSS